MTFIFRLDGEASTAYRWTGHEDQKISAKSPTELCSTRNQFLVASYEYLAVGGGSALGSNAIRIDSDLATCFAGPSDTFSNPPLAPEEEIQPFSIGTSIIVFNFCEMLFLII
jgi:hypothetical protein